MNDLATKNAANKLILKLFGPSCETFGLIMNDWAKLWRLRNLEAVLKRVERIELRRGVLGSNAHIELRIGIPAIEAISIEDNEELQDLWANLLYESLSEKGRARGVARTVLRIAKELDPNDIPILRYIYEQGKDERGEPDITWVDAKEIVRSLENIAYENGADDDMISMSNRRDQYMVAMSNLARINLIEGSQEDRLKMTPLGMQFLFSAGGFSETVSK